MEIERTIGEAPRTRELAGDLSSLRGPCIGCRDCSSLCHELIDMLIVPKIVLKDQSV